jgi:xylulokinase
VALDWARNELLPGGSVQDFDALAASAEPGSGGVEFHPGRLRTAQAWKGAGSPAQRARSVLEGIGFTVKRLVEDGLQARSNLSLVQVLGGGRKSAVWLEILAGIFNCPMRPAQGDSLLGAAAMAARRPVPEPSASSSALALPPPEAASVYRQAYEAWKRGE